MGEGRNLVGVDIGTTCIKVCQVKETRKGLALVRCGYVPLAAQAIVDGQVLDAAAVVDALQRAFKDNKIRQRECAVSVSGQSVIIRKISVPMMSAAELDEQIQWEAEQHIPFDIKDVQVDYQVLSRNQAASQMDLLLVAAKKDRIEEFAQLARSAKLKPLICDIDAFAVQNLFEHTRGLPAEQTVALLNVGASLSSLNIVAGGISAFTREIASGGGAITEEIQKQLRLSSEMAEAYKCRSALGQLETGEAIPPQVAGIIDTVCDSIAAEIQRSLDFFMATSGEGEIARVYLTGGSAALPQLPGAIQRRARVVAELWNPLEKITPQLSGGEQQLLQARASQFSVALGLCLRKEKEARL